MAFSCSISRLLPNLVILLVLASQASYGGCQSSELRPDFYSHSCPAALDIVRSVVEKAHRKEGRMGASLLRLHFHDCFVQGCDGSVLLDDTPTLRGEKTAILNNNSIRGFEVVDDIKIALEKACPSTVSCADILAIAARDSVILHGGPGWDVQLGRRDSRSASVNMANHNLPASNSTLDTLIKEFTRQGLNYVDLVALSGGGHSIGASRCVNVKQRIYNPTGNGKPRNIDDGYLAFLRSICPRKGEDDKLMTMDIGTPIVFDNQYFLNLQSLKGNLISDQALYADITKEVVDAYARDNALFFEQFAKSMVKMGNIQPLTGAQGEIRRNCRLMN